MVRRAPWWLGLALAPVLVHAAPHVPAGDDVVVETLPVRYDPQLATLRELRSAARQQPRALQPQLQLAQAYIEASRRDADPRFLGQAQAALAAWPDGADTPAQVRMLRATILQSLHSFEDALLQLDAALAQRPGYAQALLTRATVLQVLGRFEGAQRDCAALLRSGGEVVAQLCLAGVATATGRLEQATLLVSRARRDMPPTDASLRSWALTLQGEIAERRGDLPAASNALAAALQIDPDDRYARAAWCDVLLDQGLPRRVLELTEGQARDDNLLLRHALALQALAREFPQQAQWRSRLQQAVAQLQQRHAASGQRGDRTHLREQARMVLLLQQDAHEALRLARENWTIQREPADARVLLEAARAAHDESARDAVAAWMRSSGLTDARLSALLGPQS